MRRLPLVKFTRFFLILLLGGGLFSVWGCTTTTGGKFARLTPNQSTREEVRQLLGEPEEVRSQEDSDIWKYTFFSVSGPKARPGKQKALETEFYFGNDVMTDYKISVVTKSKPGMIGKPVFHGVTGTGSGPGMKPLGPNAIRFLERFDTNRDGRVTRNEFTGDPAVFRQIDINHDHIIDREELRRFRKP